MVSIFQNNDKQNARKMILHLGFFIFQLVFEVAQIFYLNIHLSNCWTNYNEP